MDGVPADARSRRVLKCKAYELCVVGPGEHDFEELADPGDDFALARAWKPVHQIEERILARGRHGVGALLVPLELHALGDVPEDGELLRVRVGLAQ